MMHSIQLFGPISLCFPGNAPLEIDVVMDQWDQNASVTDQFFFFIRFNLFKSGSAKFKLKSWSKNVFFV